MLSIIIGAGLISGLTMLVWRKREQLAYRPIHTIDNRAMLTRK
jgi:hypothetical protein